MKKMIFALAAVAFAFTACVDPIAEQRRMNDAITQEVIREMRQNNDAINKEVMRQQKQMEQQIWEAEQQAMRDANPYNPNW